MQWKRTGFLTGLPTDCTELKWFFKEGGLEQTFFKKCWYFWMLQNQDHFVTRVGIWLKTSDYRYPHTGVYKCTWCLFPSIDSRDLVSETAISRTRQQVRALGKGITLWAPVTTLTVQAPSAHAETCKRAPQFSASFKINLSQTIQSCPLTSCVWTGQSVILALCFEETVKQFRNPSQCWPRSVLQRSMPS